MLKNDNTMAVKIRLIVITPQQFIHSLLCNSNHCLFFRLYTEDIHLQMCSQDIF